MIAFPKITGRDFAFSAIYHWASKIQELLKRILEWRGNLALFLILGKARTGGLLYWCFAIILCTVYNSLSNIEEFSLPLS